ncbi:MAG: TolC family protein [Terriglobia bacterium]
MLKYRHNEMIPVHEKHFFRHCCIGLFVAGCLGGNLFAQTAFTWVQLKDKFEATNPTLKAAQINIDESRAQEITAYLRPNPQFSISADQIGHNTTSNPFKDMLNAYSVSYLHERQHKRELRRDSAKESTSVTESTALDQERSLLFNLRSAFVQLLQAKAVLQNAKENLEYWDRELAVNRKRYSAGDLDLVDLNRLELQRAQFEADFETATVNLRTGKIELLTLLNDRTPIDQFDVTGKYDFDEQLMPLEEFRNIALAARPDLKAALQSVDLAKINHKLAVANGSADPTFGFDMAFPSLTSNYLSWAFPLRQYVGINVSVPLRIFDKNQGEKLRTQLDIGRNERLQEAARAQVFSDVDSAYWTLIQALNLLKPYKARYLPLAEDTRNRISISFQNGGASLLDLLDAEKSYRDIRVAYLNLIGSYLTAAAQMNLAAGREVMQ